MAKKKVGRKRLPRARKRLSPLLIRFRLSERQELNEAAKVAGLTVTELVREAALERARGSDRGPTR